MKLADFDYKLPKELIAQYPLPKRDTSRLLVLRRKSGKVEHHTFKDIFLFLKRGDLLVLNDTKVFKARLLGNRQAGHEGKMEALLVEKKSDNLYAALCKPYRKFKEGTKIIFGNGRLRAEVAGEEDNFKLLRFYTNGNIYKILQKIGNVPLPPYIKRDPQKEDEKRYQTIYAKTTGAIAAPTAGLHFTKRLISKIKREGIDIAYITLHVGYATFKPVKEEQINRHKMHKEYFEISKNSADKINRAKDKGGRIIAVGTTACRALESAALKTAGVTECAGQATDLFIYPGFNFKVTDGLITNFHLPRTTLFMLVCAFAGKDNIAKAYSEAIEKQYRFYSYGDATLII